MIISFNRDCSNFRVSEPVAPEDKAVGSEGQDGERENVSAVGMGVDAAVTVFDHVTDFLVMQMLYNSGYNRLLIVSLCIDLFPGKLSACMFIMPNDK